jgi:hypothetical protein
MFAYDADEPMVKPREAAPTITSVDAPRPNSAWWDLLAGVYVFAAASVALLSVGWASAPYENAPRGTSTAEVLLIALAVGALITAVSAARQFLRANSARAVPAFVVSLASLAAWAITASIALS